MTAKNGSTEAQRRRRCRRATHSVALMSRVYESHPHGEIVPARQSSRPSRGAGTSEPPPNDARPRPYRQPATGNRRTLHRDPNCHGVLNRAMLEAWRCGCSPREPSRAHHLGETVEVAVGDLRDRASLREPMRGVTTVVAAAHGFAGPGRATPTSVDNHGNPGCATNVPRRGARPLILIRPAYSRASTLRRPRRRIRSCQINASRRAIRALGIDTSALSYLSHNCVPETRWSSAPDHTYNTGWRTRFRAPRDRGKAGCGCGRSESQDANTDLSGPQQILRIGPTDPRQRKRGSRLRAGYGRVWPAAARSSWSVVAPLRAAVTDACDCWSVRSCTRQNSLPKGSCMTAQSMTGGLSP